LFVILNEVQGLSLVYTKQIFRGLPAFRRSLGVACFATTRRLFPLGHFFREAEDLVAGEVPGQIRDGGMRDKIIITVIGSVKSQDSHQEEAFVKKILGNPDPIPVFKPDDGLVFR
jgi:hypothetical protein